MTEAEGAQPAGNDPNTRVVLAPGKVNLFLRVLGRRTDGYHDLETLVLPTAFGDRLTIHAAADARSFRTLSLSLEIAGDPSSVGRVPSDETNLVLRAAQALAEATGVRGFAEIRLEKRIPVAAGMGGGSADAAAALLALNDLWGAGLGPAELSDVAASVGSDVPALLRGRPVLASGRGEVVEPASVGPLRWVIVPASFGISTADAFAWWDDDGGRSGPSPEPLIQAAARGIPEEIGPLLFNDLEEPVVRRYPVLAETKARLLQSGALGVILCGSGPTMAGLLRVDVPFPRLPGARETSTAPGP